ncbi:hypothetical protein SAMN05428943_1031 [Streptomyces sp. 2314.4]|nr:hypothetical protein SAMN05428943_1031 [Streptomyces sp. 2314.4]
MHTSPAGHSRSGGSGIVPVLLVPSSPPGWAHRCSGPRAYAGVLPLSRRNMAFGFTGPRARGGWSPDPARARCPEVLLPAPAGLVPRRPTNAGGRPAAPRTRGGGPSEGAPAIRRVRCFPHPRGWSQVHLVQEFGGRLLPAPAGLVPAYRLPTLGVAAAPRTRGVGPSLAAVSRLAVRCSPHPRGWSPCQPPCRGPSQLLPAPAGLVPAPGPSRSGRFPAPRTRGVGPHVDNRLQLLKLCSPHPRGWSPAPGGVTVAPSLLPARAGLVPSASSTPAQRSTAPRTRGVGPRSCIESGSWAVNDHGSWGGEISRTSSGRCWSRCCRRG